MLAPVIAADRRLARLRPMWGWLAEFALVVLGIHPAADHVDDALAEALSQLDVAWTTPEAPLLIATWAAVGIELLTVLCVAAMAARTFGLERLGDRRTWWRRRSVATFLHPAFWSIGALAGAWQVGMAVEDTVAATLGPSAFVVAVATSLLAVWRIGAPGVWRLIIAAPPSVSRADGVLSAPLLLAMGALMVRFGLPIWGWTR